MPYLPRCVVINMSFRKQTACSQHASRKFEIYFVLRVFTHFIRTSFFSVFRRCIPPICLQHIFSCHCDLLRVCCPQYQVWKFARKTVADLLHRRKLSTQYVGEINYLYVLACRRLLRALKLLGILDTNIKGFNQANNSLNNNPNCIREMFGRAENKLIVVPQYSFRGVVL